MATSEVFRQFMAGWAINSLLRRNTMPFNFSCVGSGGGVQLLDLEGMSPRLYPFLQVFSFRFVLLTKRVKCSVINLENLQKLSSQSLMEFQQNLEVFRREPLQGKSDLMARLLEVAPSARFSRYLETGGLHEDSTRQVVVKLDSCLKGLRNHLKQAQAILAEFEILVKESSDCMLSTLCSNFEDVEIGPVDTENEGDLEAHQQGEDSSCVQKRPQPSDYVHVMSLILAMLTEDFTMQEKIVSDLGLDVKTEALQSYSLMWTLRPYVDDSVIEQALSWIE